MTVFGRLTELLESGTDVALLTVLAASPGSPARAGAKMVVGAGGEVAGTVGGGALELRATELARAAFGAGGIRTVALDLAALGMSCGGEVSLLVEVLRAEPPFLVFGGGHLGCALAPLLVSVGFQVTVYDSRPAARERLAGLAGIRVVVGPYEDLAALGDALAASRYAFVATHGHDHDAAVVERLLAASAEWRYVGVIGSQRKARELHEGIRAAGRAVPAYLHSPAGLRIGGGTPAEIALSVAAEAVAVRNGAAGGTMRLDP